MLQIDSWECLGSAQLGEAYVSFIKQSAPPQLCIADSLHASLLQLCEGAANDAVDNSHMDSFIPQGLLKLLISGEPQARELFGIIYDDFQGKRPA